MRNILVRAGGSATGTHSLRLKPEMMFNLAFGLKPVVQFISGLATSRLKEFVSSLPNSLRQINLITTGCARLAAFRVLNI